MVEVFKTDIARKSQCEAIMASLAEMFPLLKIDFDLEDCDKILRVEGKKLKAEQIIECLRANGFLCEVLNQ